MAMTKTSSDRMTLMRFCGVTCFNALKLGKLSGLDGVNKRVRFFSELNRLLERLE
jgi:hypothetical protein